MHLASAKQFTVPPDVEFQRLHRVPRPAHLVHTLTITLLNLSSAASCPLNARYYPQARLLEEEEEPFYFVQWQWQNHGLLTSSDSAC